MKVLGVVTNSKKVDNSRMQIELDYKDMKSLHGWFKMQFEGRPMRTVNPILADIYAQLDTAIKEVEGK